MILIDAAWYGDTDRVRQLLEEGADVNIANKYGNTALHRAAVRGHTAIVQLLIDNGADVDIVNKHGNTALSLAVIWGNMNTASVVFNGYMNREYRLFS